jgi:glycosyltransferase involved in cell wall biosynthesis
MSGIMNRQPLVTVICLCYNHAKYVEASIQSVLTQTYPNIQLIVMDDFSTDNSVEVITEIVKQNAEIEFIRNEYNQGNCRAFNTALKKAKGDYIIDLAADDILLKERIDKGVATFQNRSADYGVNFTDAEIINENGDFIRYHYQHNQAGLLIEKVPEGDLYALLLKKYLVCSPTIMVKREVYLQTGGYDESLAYEDFDFWVRSSRNWKYCFTEEVLVQKRELANSMGSVQYKRGSMQMYSTYRVCKKAYDLCRSQSEFEALRIRIKYEMKYSLWFGDFSLALKYLILFFKSFRG